MGKKTKYNEIMDKAIESDDFGSDDDIDEDEDDDDDDYDDDDDNNDDDIVKDEPNDNNKRTKQDQEGKPAKQGKVKESHTNLYKPPTMDELNMLRETQMLYHSNLFRLQMEELLATVSVKDKHRHQFKEWFAKLCEHLTSLPESSPLELSDKKKITRNKVHEPLVESIPKVTGSIILTPPINIEVIGSFALDTVTTVNPTIDVMMILPKKCINSSDWRNGRWLAKRIYYLSWIAESLMDKSDIVHSQLWTNHLGARSRPILQIIPSDSLGNKWKVNLHPVPSSESFNLSRFSPERSNLQPQWYFGNDKEAMLPLTNDDPPTPHYNWACAVDVVMQQQHELIMNHLGNKTNLIQGIKLIKVWFAQRDLDKGIGSLSGHMVALYVIHLLQCRKINAQMSPYQVFRNFVLHIGSVDWSVVGISMCSTQDDAPSLDTFRKLYEVVFVDPSGLVNLASMMISADFHRIQHESQLAITLLNSSASDTFESLFIKKVEMYELSDQYLCVSLKKKDAMQTLKKQKDHLLLLMDWLGDTRRVIWSSVVDVLNEGLRERKELIAPKREPSPVWPVSHPPPMHSWSVELGLIINPLHAWALLTKGPTPESDEAAKFKEFWGKQCALRRFQDGSFHEAVLWGPPSLSQAQRRLIPEKICKHVLSHHCGIEEGSIIYVAKQTEKILHTPEYKMSFEYATGEEATLKAIQAYDSLSQRLRSLDLPLKISAIQPKSDVNRHSRVFPPLPKSLPSSGQAVEVTGDHLQFSGLEGPSAEFKYTMEVIVFLEISGKWPEDLDAVQAIKAEFYLKMCDLLLRDGTKAIVFPKYLQVLWMGYFFRVQVCYLREIYLQRLVETPDMGWKEQDTPEATQLELDIEILPKLTTAIASIQADHPSFSGAVRLCKRWASAQLLMPHIPSIAVELLVVHLFLSPGQYSPPHTPHVAFFRFLRLLKNTNWNTTPILVNLNDEFNVEDVSELYRIFTSQRSTLPHMFLVTPYDLRSVARGDDSPAAASLNLRYKKASHWTKESVSLQILYRSKQLASAALKFLNVNLLTNGMDVKTIFRPSFEDFDITIHLDITKLNRRYESVDFIPKRSLKFKHYERKNAELMPIVMFDAAEIYLKELQDTFGHFALFFYDEHGGESIGVVWKPHALKMQDLKVGSIECHQLIGVKELKQVPNLEMILEDFEVLGTGLVHKVKLKKS